MQRRPRVLFRLIALAGDPKPPTVPCSRPTSGPFWISQPFGRGTPGNLTVGNQIRAIDEDRVLPPHAKDPLTVSSACGAQPLANQAFTVILAGAFTCRIRAVTDGHGEARVDLVGFSPHDCRRGRAAIEIDGHRQLYFDVDALPQSTNEESP